MVREYIAKKQLSTNKIIEFTKYKEKRPFYQKPIKIHVDTPTFDTYYMVKNVVYKGNQILALKKEMDSNTIFLVEAKIMDGQLKNISMLSNEQLGEVSGLFAESLSINQ
ncbi:MAG: hypothetical protein K0R71_1130 [Bacillales bacterium]|jgi:hypothetical protein|nr:hypothetical protein [Bacillales bacterium]